MKKNFKKNTNIKKGLIFTSVGLLGLVVVLFSASFALRITSPPTSAEIDQGVEHITHQEMIQVRILNSCGVPGLAGNCRNYLRARGFDVVETGNATNEAPHSYVIDKLGDRSSAKKVAFACGINDSLVVSRIGSSAFIRCEVVLGRDYLALKPFK